MLIQLPAETWIEILDWLRRRDLLEKLDKLWDREFTPIVQDWLHKYTRNVRIGELWAGNGGLSVRVSGWGSEKVPFPEVDMPENITGFEQITINYVDSSVLTLLRQMRPLFRNICLRTANKYYDEAVYQTALRFLMPMINSGSIESLSLDYKFLQFFSNNYASSLYNAKLMEILDSHWILVEHEQILLDWLFMERADGLPRVLIFHWSRELSRICKEIRQRFMRTARQHACPFFVRFSILIGYAELQLLNAENMQTGEQLTYKTMESSHHERRYWLITNCPMNTSAEWLDKEEAELLKWNFLNQQQVIMLNSLKISPQLYGAEEDANQEQQSNGSGKKRKLI